MKAFVWWCGFYGIPRIAVIVERVVDEGKDYYIVKSDVWLRRSGELKPAFTIPLIMYPRKKGVL